MGHDGKPVETVNPQVSACPEPAEGTGHLRSDLLKGPRSRGNLGAEFDSRSENTPYEFEPNLYTASEYRAVRAELDHLRNELAWLVGRYEVDNTIPMFEVERLLSGGSS